MIFNFSYVVGAQVDVKEDLNENLEMLYSDMSKVFYILFILDEKIIINS